MSVGQFVSDSLLHTIPTHEFLIGAQACDVTLSGLHLYRILDRFPASCYGLFSIIFNCHSPMKSQKFDRFVFLHEIKLFD